MKTAWDYTHLATAYLKRPAYADEAVAAILRISGVRRGAFACDIGAGTGNLTSLLLDRGLNVVAVEPNDAMRELGILRTESFENVVWTVASGEATSQPDNAFDLVTFGSSFNVCDSVAALRETHRILRVGGWFVCLWNHRDLEDAVQSRIESIIRDHIPSYDHGTRRQDQTTTIAATGLFGPVVRLEVDVDWAQTPEDCVEAWRSHATLARQAGSQFPTIINAIQQFLKSLNQRVITIRYTTRVWMAQRCSDDAKH